MSSATFAGSYLSISSLYFRMSKSAGGSGNFKGIIELAFVDPESRFPSSFFRMVGDDSSCEL